MMQLLCATAQIIWILVLTACGNHMEGKVRVCWSWELYGPLEITFVQIIIANSYFRKTSKVTYTHAATPLHGTHLDTLYTDNRGKGGGWGFWTHSIVLHMIISNLASVVSESRHITPTLSVFFPYSWEWMPLSNVYIVPPEEYVLW